MHRNELKTIAEGFKKARPPFTTVFAPGLEREWHQWRQDVDAVADALQLVEKARSNFLAACGVADKGQG